MELDKFFLFVSYEKNNAYLSFNSKVVFNSNSIDLIVSVVILALWPNK